MTCLPVNLVIAILVRLRIDVVAGHVPLRSVAGFVVTRLSQAALTTVQMGCDSDRSLRLLRHLLQHAVRQVRQQLLPRQLPQRLVRDVA
jgi:hypothetical protein